MIDHKDRTGIESKEMKIFSLAGESQYSPLTEGHCSKWCQPFLAPGTGLPMRI